MSKTNILIIFFLSLLIAVAGGCTKDKTASISTCGDNVCGAGENCLSCAADCSCNCGDGVCSYGEFGANCGADCDSSPAATPPMGWNSWNRYHCDIDEELIKQTADAMVESGMRKAGYQYLNLDDCWQNGRDAEGNILADSQTFSSGIPSLAEYVHALGLKFGLYTCAGTLTCAGRPGSYEHEMQDAQTYAEWQVDYVKVDWCYTEGLDSAERYRIFGKAFADSGREMILSICNWGIDSPWIWGASAGQLWRTSGDIADLWPVTLMNLYLAEPHAAYAGVAAWNDPDMLEVGNGGMSVAQYRSHFALWSIMSSPLIAGNDLVAMDEETKSILTNAEIIAVDQDPAALQGVIIEKGDDYEIWAKPLTEYGARAVVLFNKSGDDKKTFSITPELIGLAPGPVMVHDMWSGKDLGRKTGAVEFEVEPYDSGMLKVVGAEPEPARGESSIEDLTPIYAAASTAQASFGSADSIIAAPGMRVYYLGYRCSSIKLKARSIAGGEPVAISIEADNTVIEKSNGLVMGQDFETEESLEGARLLKLRVLPAGDKPARGALDLTGTTIECK